MAHFPSPYDSEKFDHERDGGDGDGNRNAGSRSRISNASGSTTATATASAEQQHQYQHYNKDEDLENQQQLQPLIGQYGSADGNQENTDTKDKKKHLQKWSASTSTWSPMKIVIIVGIAVLVAVGIFIGVGLCLGCGGSETEDQHQQPEGTTSTGVSNEESGITTGTRLGEEGKDEEEHEENPDHTRPAWQVQVDYNVISKFILNDFTKKPEDYNMSKFEPPIFKTLNIKDNTLNLNEQQGQKQNDTNAKPKAKHRVDIYMQYVQNELYDLDNGSWYASVQDINGGKYKYDPSNPPCPQRAQTNVMRTEANITTEYKDQVVNQIKLQYNQSGNVQQGYSSDPKRIEQLQKQLEKTQSVLALQKECFLAYAEMVKDGVLLSDKYSSNFFTNPEFHPTSKKHRVYGSKIIPPAKYLSIEEPYAGFVQGGVLSSEYDQLEYDIEQLEKQQKEQENLNLNKDRIDKLKKELKLLTQADNFRTYWNRHNDPYSFQVEELFFQKYPEQLSLYVAHIELGSRVGLLDKFTVEKANRIEQNKALKLKEKQLQEQENKDVEQGDHQGEQVQVETYKDMQDLQQKLYKSGQFSGPLGDNAEFSEKLQHFFDLQDIPHKMLRDNKNLVFSVAFERGAGGQKYGVDPSLLNKGTSVSDEVSVYNAGTFLLNKEYIRENVSEPNNNQDDDGKCNGEVCDGHCLDNVCFSCKSKTGEDNKTEIECDDPYGMCFPPGMKVFNEDSDVPKCMQTQNANWQTMFGDRECNDQCSTCSNNVCIIYREEISQKNKSTNAKSKKRYVSQSEYDEYCGDKAVNKNLNGKESVNVKDSDKDEQKQKAPRPTQLFQLSGHSIQMRFATKKIIKQLRTNPKYNNNINNKDNKESPGLYQKLEQHILQIQNSPPTPKEIADYFMQYTTAYIGHLQFLKDLQADQHYNQMYHTPIKQTSTSTNKNKFNKSMYQNQMQNERSIMNGLAVMKFGSFDSHSVRQQEKLAGEIIEKNQKNLAIGLAGGGGGGNITIQGSQGQ